MLSTVKPNDRTQELLAEIDAMRADIQAGVVVDYAIATVMADRRIGAQWSSTADKWRLVGAIENLKFDLMAGGK